MNKGEFVSRVKDSLNISSASAKRVVDTVFGILKESIKDEEGLVMAKFGTLQAVERKQRTCRNPRTGEKVQVPSKVTVKFKPSVAFKRELNA